MDDDARRCGFRGERFFYPTLLVLFTPKLRGREAEVAAELFQVKN